MSRKPSRALQRDLIPGEEWRAVPGWEGVYEVSNLGRAYRVQEKGFPKSGRLLRLANNSSGYPSVNLWRNGAKRTWPIHHLVLLAFVGPRPDGLVVRHLDGDPTNNLLENLRYGTSSENNFDKVRHGRDHNASKTHCIRGHEFTPENTYVQPSVGGRRCLTCKKQSARDWWEQNGDSRNAQRRDGGRAA